MRSPHSASASGSLAAKSVRESTRPLARSSTTTARRPDGSRPATSTRLCQTSGSPSKPSGPKVQATPGSSASGATSAAPAPSGAPPGCDQRLDPCAERTPHSARIESRNGARTEEPLSAASAPDRTTVGLAQHWPGNEPAMTPAHDEPQAGAEHERWPERWRERFPILADTTYLVTHSLGAMPRAVYGKLQAFADQW